MGGGGWSASFVVESAGAAGVVAATPASTTPRVCIEGEGTVTSTLAGRGEYSVVNLVFELVDTAPTAARGRGSAEEDAAEEGEEDDDDDDEKEEVGGVSSLFFLLPNMGVQHGVVARGKARNLGAATPRARRRLR